MAVQVFGIVHLSFSFTRPLNESSFFFRRIVSILGERGMWQFFFSFSFSYLFSRFDLPFPAPSTMKKTLISFFPLPVRLKWSLAATHSGAGCRLQSPTPPSWLLGFTFSPFCPKDPTYFPNYGAELIFPKAPSLF